MIRHLSWILVILMGLTLFWAPLPFGSVTPWGTAVLQGSSFLLLALALLRSRSLEGFTPTLAPSLALAGIALLGVLQAAPWPLSWVEAISPAHGEIYRQASDLAAASGGSEFSPRLTLTPDVSRRTALTWAAWAALLAAAVVAGRHALHRRLLAAALVAAAGFQIVYGMQRFMGGISTIWNTPVPGATHRLRGTFVNPDHFALFLELTLVVCFAWLWWASRRWRRVETLEGRLLLVVPPILLWLTCFVALAFSGSRAGLLAALTGLAAQTVLLSGSRRRGRSFLLAGGVLGIGLAVVALVGARYGFGRWFETSAYELTWGSRFQALRASLELWHDFLWTGTGLGTFQDAFPLVQPAALKGRFLHAHSDPVELGVTTGILGSAVALLGSFFLLRRLFRLSRNGLRSEDRAAALAALGGLASVAFHESLDFGLTMPANAFALVVLCGAACGARMASADMAGQRSSFHRGAGETRSRPGRTDPPARFSNSST